MDLVYNVIRPTCKNTVSVSSVYFETILLLQKESVPIITMDTCYTLVPINWILRCFVLSGVKKKNDQLTSSWSLLENMIVFIIMTTVNAFFLMYKIQGFETNEGSGTIEFIHSLQLLFIIGYAQYIIDIIFVYRFRNKSLQYMLLYQDIDSILGYPNFIIMRSIVAKTIAFFTVDIFVVSALDFFFGILHMDGPLLYNTPWIIFTSLSTR